MTIQEELLKQNFPNKWKIVINSEVNKERKFKRNFKRICSIRRREFIAGGNSSWCGFCSLEYRCNHCQKWIPFSIQKFYKLNLNNEYGCLEYSHYLGAKLKMASGKCCNCGKQVEKRDQFCFGYDCGCHNKIYSEHNKSNIMRKISSENGTKYGIQNLINYNRSDQGRQKSKELMEKLNKSGLNTFIGSKEQQNHLENLNKNLREFNFNTDCSKSCIYYQNCQNKNKKDFILKNKYGFCKYYVNSWSALPNFITKNNVRYYKDKELDQLCKDLLSGKEDISNYPGFNIHFGEVYYNSENVLTEEINKFNNSSFYEKDDQLYYFDKEISDYILWDKFKKKFLVLSKDINLPKDFIIIPTFRTQDSENWEGAKQAFEQSLLDLNIEWFVYIKFYIDNECKSIPLVCGKSGSLNVNYSGSNLSFSTDINDGPARRFLAENKLKWDKTKIAILKCNNENEAYEKEKHYLNKLNLFGC